MYFFSINDVMGACLQTVGKSNLKYKSPMGKISKMSKYTGKLNLKEINSQYTCIPISRRIQLSFIFVDKVHVLYWKLMYEKHC